MTLSADLFWSFRSPYSYLATRRYRALCDEYALQINLRPVYPMSLRDPDFFAHQHVNWMRYTLIDVTRIAERLGIGFALPRPDPIVQDMVTRKVAAEQPYIYRITRLGQVAARAGRALEFADEVSQLIWNGTPDWHQGNHLANAAARAGLDLAVLDLEVRAHAVMLDAEIAANQSALAAAGHWGVPTLVFDGEAFFGQDRIDLALWRMQQKGLKARDLAA